MFNLLGSGPRIVGGNTHPVKSHIRQLFFLDILPADNSTDQELVALFEREGGSYEAPQSSEFIAALKSKGYDSVAGGESGGRAMTMASMGFESGAP